MRLAADYPVKVVCQVLDYPHSSFYRQDNKPEDLSLRGAIEAVATAWPTYGYRRVSAQLRRQGWHVNTKRILRLMGEQGLKAKRFPRKRRTTNSHHPFPRFANLVQDMEVVRPDQVWVADITYIRLRHQFGYLAVIMDVFTRCVRGWQLGRSLDQELTLVALRRTLARHKPQVHHSDQGVQYAAAAYVQLLKEAEVNISMAEAGQSLAEWLCGAHDADHQGRRGGPIRLPRRLEGL